MLNVKLFELQKFLAEPYEESLAPRLKEAEEKLQNASGAGGEFTGWVHLPRDYDKEEFARIEAAAKRIQSNSQALVVIGIGGSYLGARAAMELLQGKNRNIGKGKGDPQIFFAGNNLSTRYFNELTGLLKDKDFSVIVTSKSGTAMEPAIAFRSLRWMLERKYGTDDFK